jgi:molybdate transport system substrate-binding protein
MTRSLAVCTILLGLVAGCRPQPAQTVSIFAAASTGDVLEEISRDFEADTGIRVKINASASSTLAVQIEKGADADLFLSADEKRADDVNKLSDLRRNLLANRLVVVVPADNPVSFHSLDDLKAPQYRRIAVAHEGVPAGDYAREALSKSGLWDALKGRTIEGGDVRATLNYVRQGEADAGFVYATDAASSSKVRVAFDVPENLHKPIRYPLVLLHREQPNPAAGRFYDYLAGDKATAAFRRAGFQTLP